jgi:anti-sigma regulatory factor (Ser/Thr protein kinase)
LNVVEHAYGGRAGNLTVQGEQLGETLTITIRDYGQWRPQTDRGRGRGTRIMQGFADIAKTHTGPTGTIVELSWALPGKTPALP